MNVHLEIVTAVLLVIVIFSIIAYVIQELIAANLEYRGKMLKKALQLLLDTTNTAGKISGLVYQHPQINKLKETAEKLPSYIPAANFALALMDEVAKAAPAAAANNMFINFRNGIRSFAGTNADLATLLNNYLATSRDLEELKATIEKWYNEYMDRVTGWYKKSTRLTMRIIAIGIVIVFNVNLIKIFRVVKSDDSIRAALVISAEKMVDQPAFIKSLYEENIKSKLLAAEESFKDSLNKAIAAKSIDTVNIKKRIAAEKDNILDNYTNRQKAEMDTLLQKIKIAGLPLGWDHKEWKSFKGAPVETILGWFLAAVAISMGAPFWFDLLIKIVNIRRSGIKPKEE